MLPRCLVGGPSPSPLALNPIIPRYDQIRSHTASQVQIPMVANPIEDEDQSQAEASAMTTTVGQSGTTWNS